MIQTQKGTKDILPGEISQWQYVESVIRSITSDYGFKEIRTPTFESTDLFLRSVGDTTDIVQKEMYTFLDKGNRSITLKPEGTAGVVRSFIQNGMFNDALPTKLYYLYNPVFRYERPQEGRLREHHQFGVEMFGSNDPSSDAEIIMLAWNLINKLKINDIQLRINSIGCKECRKEYNKALKQFLEKNIENMCFDCQSRFERNPMRILDCKNEECKKYNENAPKIIDYLCDSCKSHFEQLKNYLTIAGIEFVVDARIVRGLDYYCNTVFEIVTNSIGSQGTVCGGGRYNTLVEMLGGPKNMPGMGFGLGMERLILLMNRQNFDWPKEREVDVYFCTFNQEAKEQAFKFANELRQKGINAQIDLMNRGVKAQFKYANKINAKKVVIIGEQELIDKKAKLKDMQSSEESMINFEDLTSVF